ncbi:MAG: type II toxin-antitoxin system RelE/ParE family toxin [Candidatus Sulfotelmatobacter sp.]
MKKRRLVFSDAAIADILEQADWYAAQAGRSLARRWEQAVKSAILQATRRPATGALCLFRSKALRDVRRTNITGFPKHLIFYRFDDDEVFVLRVVHGARDLERLFS